MDKGGGIVELTEREKSIAIEAFICGYEGAGSGNIKKQFDKAKEGAENFIARWGGSLAEGADASTEERLSKEAG